ncbi:4'-phosphopantetheinyl transferase sfp [Streptomyces sp. ADI96-02]|uniref:4'-phosphopantetheinyl transferase family protein n=1 Tax=Streptomyces sp. ADI96-02 TaxID=1522760 RepID=UPI000F552398|nr:4'-phosphopantetheinyl transferase superfamily protein [Streptomyces sp. ADI96-02]RPK65804.1 4'-phosphopantetheinyl transferase sfp [Streptomyces sp. ADI96-02]
MPLSLAPAPGVWVLLSSTRDPAAGRLTAQDRAHARRLTGPARRRAHLAGRRTLRALLAERFPEAAAATVGYGPTGRPVLPDLPRVGVSVSHSGTAVAVCAAYDREVGVDVQQPPQEVAASLLRWCAPHHRTTLLALPEHARATEFAWLWTVKEALGKAAGTGVAGAAFHAEPAPGDTHGAWDGLNWTSLRNSSPLPLSCAYGPIREPT